MRGAWDSIHVVEVKETNKKAKYKLTSTVMLSIETSNESTGTVSLAGSLTRQYEKEALVSTESPHIANIGKLVEDSEIAMRESLDTIYFGKTRQIKDQLRIPLGNTVLTDRVALSKALGAAVKK